MPDAFPVMIEILELSVKLGDLSKMPTINDTAPWVDAYTTPGGTPVPDGWAGRPPNDGWHWSWQALDQGGWGETELAQFWFNNRGRGVKELIHNDGNRGWVITNYWVGVWNSAWGHLDHVHTAMEYADAVRWRNELKKRDDENTQVVVYIS